MARENVFRRRVVPWVATAFVLGTATMAGAQDKLVTQAKGKPAPQPTLVTAEFRAPGQYCAGGDRIAADSPDCVSRPYSGYSGGGVGSEGTYINPNGGLMIVLKTSGRTMQFDFTGTPAEDYEDDPAVALLCDRASQLGRGWLTSSDVQFGMNVVDSSGQTIGLENLAAGGTGRGIGTINFYTDSSHRWTLWFNQQVLVTRTDSNRWTMVSDPTGAHMRLGCTVIKKGRYQSADDSLWDVPFMITVTK